MIKECVTIYSQFLKKIRSFVRSLGKESLINLSLRGVTLVAKFLLSLLIVKELSVSDLGSFGIFQTTIIIMLYILGMDFYTFNTREIINGKRQLSFYITNQFAFHGFLYVIFIPLSLFIFIYDIIDYKYLFYFYSILIFEHLSQELYRIHVSLKRSNLATFTLFLRSGIWIYVLLLVWWYKNGSLDDVFLYWLIGALVSVIAGFITLKTQISFKSIDVSWILKGVRLSIPFFLGTVFYKIVEFSGRYFLDFYFDKTQVGIYTFFGGISNTIFVFVHSTVIIIMSPRLIESANKGINEFIGAYSNFKKSIITYCFVGAVLSSIVIYPVLLFIDKSELLRNIEVFFILLIGVVLFCLSYIPHYGLYSHNKDFFILKAAAITSVTNIGLNFLLIPKLGSMGAAWAQLVSFGVLLLIKTVYFKTQLKLKSEDEK